MEFLPGVPISHSPPAIVFGKDVTGLKAEPAHRRAVRHGRVQVLI